MYRRLIRLLRTDTAKDASAMTVGTGVGAVIAAVFFIITARLLGPKQFGIFSLATAASLMFADLVDLALNATLVRFVASELGEGSGEEGKYLKFILKLKAVAGSFFIATTIIFALPFSHLLFGQNLPTVLILTGLGTGFQLLLSFGIAHLQARISFVKAASVSVILPLLRLTGLLALWGLGLVRTIATLAVYFFATPVAVVVAFFLAPREFLKQKGENRVARNVFRYSLPLTAGFSLAAVSGKIDNFILANLAGSESVGFYAAAMRLFTPAQLLAGSLTTVFAPRLAGFTTKKQANTYVVKTIIAMGGLSLLLLFLIPAAPLIIRLFYGVQYEPSVMVMRILLVGYAAFLMQAPFTAYILYSLAKPRAFAALSGLQLAIVVLADLVLIPRYQQNGAALAFVITQLVVLVLFMVYALMHLKTEPSREQ